MDSIVNDILLPLGQATATMCQLKVDDFVIGTAGSNGVAAMQTLLVVSGQPPLVVADPTRRHSGGAVSVGHVEFTDSRGFGERQVNTQGRQMRRVLSFSRERNHGFWCTLGAL
jgi:hypothetical protein